MRHILLIDADRIAPLITETLMAGIKEEHEISKASSGREGLQILINADAGKQPLPDVIFLDLMMSDINAFEFLQSLLKLTIRGIERVRIAVLSSSDNAQDQARAKLLGAHYYLTTPATIDQLKGILE